MGAVIPHGGLRTKDFAYATHYLSRQNVTIPHGGLRTP